MKYEIYLDGKKEFYPGLNNKTYNILLVNSKEKIIFMINFFETFIKNQNNDLKRKYYIGCDFEFNKVKKSEREVALFQINCEIEDNNIGTIFVFYPPELDKNQNKVLIKLLTNRQIIKILHGGESLDIPYLFNQLLITKENIKNFCSNLYDTKYLCEFSHIEKNIEKKCSIYYLLEEFNIITSQKFKDLESIEDKTGPIYLITIDIHNISRDVLRYSLYDVLFLPELIKKIIKKGFIYDKLIPEISSAVFQYKRLPDHKINTIKNIINSYNNNFIVVNDNIYLLNEIYNYHMVTLYNKKISNLYKITYFKEFSDTIYKYITYKVLLDNNKVFSSKNVNAKPIQIFNFNEYPLIQNLLNEYKNEIMNS